MAQWLALQTSSANREVGGSNLTVSIVDALLRAIACAAPGSLSRIYKKLCMRVK